MLILPIAVAGMVFIVKYNWALAFALAGIVAAVRFRTTLQDTKDAVYVFLAIGVGLASGAFYLAVAGILSIVFNAVILYLFWSNFGNIYADQRSRTGAHGLGRCSGRPRISLHGPLHGGPPAPGGHDPGGDPGRGHPSGPDGSVPQGRAIEKEERDDSTPSSSSMPSSWWGLRHWWRRSSTRWRSDGSWRRSFQELELVGLGVPRPAEAGRIRHPASGVAEECSRAARCWQRSSGPWKGWPSIDEVDSAPPYFSGLPHGRTHRSSPVLGLALLLLSVGSFHRSSPNRTSRPRTFDLSLGCRVSS